MLLPCVEVSVHSFHVARLWAGLASCTVGFAVTEA